MFKKKRKRKRRKRSAENTKERTQKNSQCSFFSGGGRVSSGQRAEYPRILSSSFLPPPLPTTLPSSPLLSSLSAGWQPLASFPSHIFNGYLPNHVFYCRKFQHTTLRESKESSILSSARRVPGRVELASAHVHVWVCERG